MEEVADVQVVAVFRLFYKIVDKVGLEVDLFMVAKPFQSPKKYKLLDLLS